MKTGFKYRLALLILAVAAASAGPTFAEEKTGPLTSAEMRKQAEDKAREIPERKALAEGSRRRLNSENPAQMAWGAWMVAQHRLEELTPEVEKKAVDLIEKHKGKRVPSREMTSLLDALIQNEAKVAPETIAAVFDAGFKDAAIILASFYPADNQTKLLEICRAQSDKPLTPLAAAACNLLLEIKSEEFADLLFRDIKPTIDIVVQMPDDEDIFPGRRQRVGSRDGANMTAPGWPPMALYKISFKPIKGRILFAPGPKPVYFERTKSYFFDPLRSPPTVQDYFLDCVIELAGKEKKLEPFISLRRRVNWVGEDGYVKEIARMNTELRERWKRAGAVLLANQRLPADFPLDDYPAFEWKVEDRRADKTEPLPDIKAFLRGKAEAEEIF